MNDPNRSGFAIMSALLGAGLWLVLAISVPFGNEHLDLIKLLLLLAILVHVPLGLDLLSSPAGNPPAYRLARFMQPPAALLAVASFFLPVGIAGAALAAGWLVFALVVALFGVQRLLAKVRTSIDEYCLIAALVYLPVGAAWLVVSRLGAAPLGFGGLVAFLTAIHFHYAGFLAPLLAAMAGRMIRPENTGTLRLYRVAATGIIAGPPLVALGITISPRVEVISATILALCIVLLAAISLAAIVPVLTSRRARILLRISALASSTAMLFALVYATSNYLRMLLVAIPEMAVVHGCVNALFALTGLLCWGIVRPQASQPITSAYPNPPISNR